MAVGYTNVKRYKRGVKTPDGSRNRTCMKCGKIAVVAAIWTTGNGFKFQVRYCDDHANEYIYQEH